jgi:hypothetical protein
MDWEKRVRSNHSRYILLSLLCQPFWNVKLIQIAELIDKFEMSSISNCRVLIHVLHEGLNPPQLQTSF